MSERDQEDVGQEEWIVPERDPERSETAARVASQLDRIMARQSGHFRVGDQHTGQIVSKELITAHPTFLGEVAGVIARRFEPTTITARFSIFRACMGRSGASGIL